MLCVVISSKHSKGFWEPAGGMAAVLVQGGVSLPKPVDCGDGMSIPEHPSDLGMSTSLLEESVLGACCLVGVCPCSFISVVLSTPA